LLARIDNRSVELRRERLIESGEGAATIRVRERG
jgi:hypothetical protein